MPTTAKSKPRASKPTASAKRSPRGRASKQRGWVILFAHGAGASSSSAWMRGWAKKLETIGPVVAFDYPYMRAGKKRPDPQAKLVEAHREALGLVRASHPHSRIVLAGKSMGSRIGCHLSLEEPVDALVCLGFPLKAPGSGKLRNEVLEQLRTPILFVQGTRDPLCPLDALKRVRRKMTAPNDLHVVETGNHSLEITARHAREAGITQSAIDADILAHVERFLATIP